MTSARIVTPGQAMATIPTMTARMPSRINEVDVDLNITGIPSVCLSRTTFIWDSVVRVMFRRHDGRPFPPTSAAYGGIAAGYGKLTKAIQILAGRAPRTRGAATLLGTAKLSASMTSTAPRREAARRPGRSGFQPGEQVGVDGGGLGGRHAVREAVVGLQRPVLDELGGQRPGVGVGHDLVVIAVHDQDRHRDRLEVLGEVGLGERHDAVVLGLGAAHHALPPPVVDDRLDRRDAGPV